MLTSQEASTQGVGMSTQSVGAPIVADRGSYPIQDTPYRGGGGGDVTYGNQDVAQAQNQNFMQLLQALRLEALLNLFKPTVYGQRGASTQSSGMFGMPANSGVARER